MEALLACGDNFLSLTVAGKDLVHVELNGQFLAGVVYVFNRHATRPSCRSGFEVTIDSEPIGSEIWIVAVTGTWLGSLTFAASNFVDSFLRMIMLRLLTDDVHCLLFSYRAKTGE